MAQDGDRISVGWAATVGIILAIAAMLAIVGAAAIFDPAIDHAAQHRQAMAELDKLIDRAKAETAAAKVASEPKLKLGSWRCYSEHGYYYVAGRVTNISDASLDNVTAVATFETKDGQFVKNDQAMADYQPIMAGQTSPFTVITTGNPAIARCRLAIQHLFGAAIPYNE